MEAYQIIDNTPVLTVNQWCESGLTYNQFRVDSRSGYLSIFQRGLNGQTLIDARSIKRPERRCRIESLLGKIAEAPKNSIYKVEIDANARAFYVAHRKADGEPLTPEKINEYTNRASIFNVLRTGMKKQIETRASCGNKQRKSEFWRERLEWHTQMAIEYNIPVFSNKRSLERAFKEYLNSGYKAIIHKNLCNDSARVVSVSAEKLMLSIWRMHGKPYKTRVLELYLEFVSGNKEIHDKDTGEIFRPEDFRYIPKGGGEPRALEFGIGTVWNYLKDHVNDAATYAYRNGQFAHRVNKRPFHHRFVGEYSLSKVSMDDADLSRKWKGGYIHRYCAVDVKSGYWFAPVYTREELTAEDVMQCFRNMFCELDLSGLPIPGEIEREHHLMDGLDEDFWKVFPFVRVCSSSIEKRAEHCIGALKLGVAKKNNHTRGRFFAKSEANRSIRYKKKGDFVEKAFDPDVIIKDDRNDIEEHNNTLHPLQKTYRGMTRKQVFLQHINKDLPSMEKWYLYKFIGNETETSIRNNDYCAVNYNKFLLENFENLKRLKPGNTDVKAYWLPLDDGSVDRVYLYQDDTYIGEAFNSKQIEYNEFAFERTEEDEAKMLMQHKRAAKFDKLTKDNRGFRIGIIDSETSSAIAAVPVEIVKTAQPEELEYDDCEMIDYEQKSLETL